MATTYNALKAKNGFVAQGTDTSGVGLHLEAGGKLKLSDASGNYSATIGIPSLTADYTLTLPANDGNANDFLKSDGAGNLSWASLGDIGGGTVTSVSATVPTGLTVSGSPVTTSGTLAIALDTGYTIPTVSALDAKLEASDIADKIELTSLSATVAAANGNGNFAYDNTTGAFTYTPPDLSSYLTSVAFADLTGKPTTLAGYGITDAVASSSISTFGASLIDDADAATARGTLGLGSAATTNSADYATAAQGALADSALQNLVEDTSPQLGGNLDLNGNGLTTNSNSTLTFGPTGAFTVTYGPLYSEAFKIASDGQVTISSQKFPASDGTSGQVLETDGAGNLSWATPAAETVTSLSLVGNTLTYTDENGAANNIDLSAYLDEDARAIASGVLDAGTGVVTFTRDDTTTFTLDLSALLDDTNLVTSVAGKSGVVTLVKADITDFSDADYATAAQGTLADSAVQPGDNVSDLTNDAGYITGYTETDTLDSVTDRNSVTSNNITVGNILTSGVFLTNTPGSSVSESFIDTATVASGTSLSLSITSGMALKVTVKARDLSTSDIHVIEMLAIYDGTDVHLTEYGSVYSSGELFTSTTSSGGGATGDITINTSSTCKITATYTSL